MSDVPFVTLVMPCLNEEDYIRTCLEGILAQDYPADKMEILVVDGMSIDRTREIVLSFHQKDARVVLLDNPERLQAVAMNHGIKRAKGDFVLRLDAHAEYASDFVRNAVDVLSETGADNAGGAARPKAKTPFQQAVAAALKSPLAVGGSKYRDATNEGWVESVFPGAFRKDIFRKVGLFDPHAVTNEDAEMNQRILAAGGKVYLSRKIIAYYYPRSSYPALFRQYFRYGKGRARTLLKHQKLLSLRPALPFLAVVSGGILVASSAYHPLTPVCAAAYAGVTLLEALRVAAPLGPRGVLTTWGIFPVLHVAHGLGFGAGLAQYLAHPDWGHDERLTDRDGPEPSAQKNGHAILQGA